MYIIELRTLDYELKQQYETKLPFIIMAEYGDVITVTDIDGTSSMSMVVRDEGPYRITPNNIDLHYH